MRFLRLPPNFKGRDFVVGDLHGCYASLMELLDLVSFDQESDRLFSVGDIIDRGPDSEKCLQLIFEPWFFMVKGNHESMFCDAVANVTTFMNRSDYLNEDNGGIWTKSWFFRGASELDFWTEKLTTLPYVISVQGSSAKTPFWVVHAELRSTQKELLPEDIEDYVENADFEELSILQWKREIAKRNPIPYAPRLTGPIYCGHSSVKNPPDVHCGHWNLDGGAGKWQGRYAFKDPKLVMLCHDTGQVFSLDLNTTK